MENRLDTKTLLCWIFGKPGERTATVGRVHRRVCEDFRDHNKEDDASRRMDDEEEGSWQRQSVGSEEAGLVL